MTKTVYAKDGSLLAIVAEYDPSAEEGIKFITPPGLSAQVGVMRRPGGYEVAAHRHKQRERSFVRTKEVLFVRKGHIFIRLYDNDKTYIELVHLFEGDIILLVDGFHAITYKQDSDIAEVKDGPYEGEDKEWL